MKQVLLSTRGVCLLILLILSILSVDFYHRYQNISKTVETTRLDFLEDFTDLLGQVLLSGSGSLSQIERNLTFSFQDARHSNHSELTEDGLWVTGTRISLWSDTGHKVLEGPGPAEDPLSSKPLAVPINTLQSLCIREAAYESDYGLTRITCPLIQHGQTLGALSISRHDHRVQQLVHSSQMTILSLGFESFLIILLMAVFLVCAILRPIDLWQEYVRVLKAGKVPHQLRLDRTILGPVGQILDHLLASISGDRFLKNYVHKLTHQYQNPLQRLINAVLALGELYPQDERLSDITMQMHNELKALARFNGMVMSLGKLEELKKLSSASRCALQDIVSQTISSFEYTLNLERIPVELVLQACTVWGDDFLIQEALANLIQNGIDFSRPGDRMTITLKHQKERVELRIRDRGLGIPDYAERRMFERFFTTPRTHRSTTGHGLGLCYVKEIMDLHGGSVTIHNHPEGGVEASLFFPARN